ncbi:MAG TPA: hypothetical protein VJ824_12920 [Bacillota bacterium]|nr:hypothetical protein [Bacillota bacterium]
MKKFTPQELTQRVELVEDEIGALIKERLHYERIILSANLAEQKVKDIDSKIVAKDVERKQLMHQAQQERVNAVLVVLNTMGGVQ